MIVYISVIVKTVIQFLKPSMFRFPARELDPYRTLAEAATVVSLRRRRTRSEAAKQEAELLTSKRRTKFLQDQVQEVRRLATNLTYVCFSGKTHPWEQRSEVEVKHYKKITFYSQKQKRNIMCCCAIHLAADSAKDLTKWSNVLECM